MKRMLSGLASCALMLTVSCKKDVGGLPDNSWSVSGKNFTSSVVTASAAGSYISASDSKGSSLDLSFKALPSASADFMVSDVASPSEVSIRAVLSGNIVYHSVPGTAGFVSVRVNTGKYTVIMNEVKLVNADRPADTVRVSSNIIEN